MSSTLPPTITLVLPPPNSPTQRAFTESAARYVCVEAGTKAGKTAGAILWMLRQAWERPGTRWWWVAPIYRQAEVAFGRIRIMLLRAGVPIGVHESRLVITLPHSGVIEFRSAEDPDNLYGDDVHGAVIDEAVRVRGEAFAAVRTTLTATGGRMLCISTPRGRRNWFWKLCQVAKDTEEHDIEYFTMRTLDNPVIHQEDVEDARRRLPDRVWRELYLAEAQPDASVVFRGIDACVDGDLEPPQESLTYVAGIDLGRHENYTVVCVLDARRRHLVAFDRFGRIDWSLQKARIKVLLDQYRATALIDATSSQDAIVEDLARMGSSVRPFVFTGPSKQQLIEGLIVAVEQRQITFPDIPVLLSEMSAFGYRATRTSVEYGAPEGMHDDCVMALAMAWRMAGPPITETPEIAMGERRETADRFW